MNIGGGDIIEKFMGPPLAALRLAEARLVRAVRVWCVARIGGVDGQDRIAALLDCAAAAGAFDRYMEAALTHWPEPPVVCRPCCRFASHDELTLVQIITAAGRADRATAHRLVGEMLAMPACDALYARALAVAATV